MLYLSHAYLQENASDYFNQSAFTKFNADTYFVTYERQIDSDTFECYAVKLHPIKVESSSTLFELKPYLLQCKFSKSSDCSELVSESLISEIDDSAMIFKDFFEYLDYEKHESHVMFTSDVMSILSQLKDYFHYYSEGSSIYGAFSCFVLKGDLKISHYSELVVGSGTLTMRGTGQDIPINFDAVHTGGIFDTSEEDFDEETTLDAFGCSLSENYISELFDKANVFNI